MKVKRIPGKDRHSLEIALNNKHLEGKVGKVGWFKGDKYPDGTNVAYVAAIHEKGYAPKNIPARPFMRPTIIQYSMTWKRIAFLGSQDVIQGKSTISKVMGQIGLHASGKIRKTISKIYIPPLKASTIQNRLSRYSNKSKIGDLHKPLIDTKHMYNTLTNTVEDG